MSTTPPKTPSTNRLPPLRQAWMLVLAGYATVYCLPCLILLIVGLIARHRVTAPLQSIVTRFGTGTIRRSVPVAITLNVLGVAVASIPFWLL